jgi:signal transduction histidine kinase
VYAGQVSLKRRLIPRFEDPSLEARFQDARLARSLPRVRGALVVVAAIASAWAIPDVALNPPAVWHLLLLNRFGVCVPLLLGPLVASYFEWGRRRLVGMLSVMAVLFYVAQAGGTFSTLTLPLRHDTLFGMLLVVVLQYFILNLPMRMLYLTGLGVSLSHTALCWAVALPPPLVFMHGFVVLALSAGCLFAALQLEQAERRTFAVNEDLALRSTELEQALGRLQAMQTDLVQAEKLASVATLVSGIAHELNNPINFVAGNMGPLRRYSDFLVGVASQLADGHARTAEEVAALTQLTPKKDLSFVSSDLARLTADISEGARRAQLIISDLQNLGSAGRRAIERVQLHLVVKQTVALRSPLPSGVDIELDLQPVPEVSARAGELEQVLTNLVDNALHAVNGKGRIGVCVKTEGSSAVVRVSDDGPGMSAAVQRHAFEPFFTTRAAGKGSGLGLAIVSRIVRNHGGAVTLSSEPGHGTTVELRLPLPAA